MTATVRARPLGEAVPTCAVSSAPGRSGEDVAAAWRDEQTVIVRCAFCPGWSFAGPAGEAREQTRAHREVHSAPKAERPRRVGNARRRREAMPAVEARRARRDPKWTRERALEALAAFVRGHGQPPLRHEATAANGLPAHSVQDNLFGSFGAYVEAGGHPRPRRGRPKVPGSPARAASTEGTPEPGGPAGAPQAAPDAAVRPAPAVARRRRRAA